jgi:hypothetical protein
MPKKQFRVGLIGAFVFLGLVLSVGCSQSGVKETQITAENRDEVLAALEDELTLREGELLKAYLERTHPDLGAGELPVGGTVQQMIDAESLMRAQEDAEVEEQDLKPEDSAGGEEAALTQEDGSAPPTDPPAEETKPPEGTKGAEPAEKEPTEPKPEPEPKVRMATVGEGTELEIRLAQTISSKTNTAGQGFEAILDKDLVVDSVLVAPEGSLVSGKITHAKKAPKTKGRAELSLTLESIQVEERTYDVDTNEMAFQAEGTGKKDALKIAIGAGIGTAIGAIAGGGKGAAIGAAVGGGGATGAVMLMPGKEVEFSPEHLLAFRVETELKMQVVK